MLAGRNIGELSWGSPGVERPEPQEPPPLCLKSSSTDIKVAKIFEEERDEELREEDVSSDVRLFAFGLDRVKNWARSEPVTLYRRAKLTSSVASRRAYALSSISCSDRFGFI
jgi:hypothetical protein